MAAPVAGAADGGGTSPPPSKTPWEDHRGRLAWLPIAAALVVNAGFAAAYLLTVECRLAPRVALATSGGARGAVGCALTTVPPLKLGAVSALGDLTARLHWLGTLCVALVGVILAVGVAVHAVHACCSRHGGTWRFAAPLAVGVTVLLTLGYVGYLERGPLPLAVWLQQPKMPQFASWTTLRAWRLGGYFAAVILLGLSGGAIVLGEGRGRQDVATLGRLFGRLRRLLLAGAVVLVGYMLESKATYGWAIAAAATDADRKAVESAVAAFAAWIGTTYSLTLAAIWLPAFLLVREQARTLAREAVAGPPDAPAPGMLVAQAGSPASVDAWLQAQGLVMSVPQSAGNALALLSPLLAGTPVVHLLGALR